MAKTKESAASPPTHEEDPLMNLSEVARALGKTPPTIFRWVTDGLLVAVRQPSGLWAVRRSEVNRFLGGSALHKQVS